MSDALGPMVYAENEGEVFLGRSVTKTTNMSEETMQRVDMEVRRIIDEQYATARKLIEDNQDKMHAMAKALLEWETIDGEQVDDTDAARAAPLTARGGEGATSHMRGAGVHARVGVGGVKRVREGLGGTMEVEVGAGSFGPLGSSNPPTYDALSLRISVTVPLP